MKEKQRDHVDAETSVLFSEEKKRPNLGVLTLLGLVLLSLCAGAGYLTGRLTAPVRHLDVSKDFDVEDRAFDQLVSPTTETAFNWKFSDIFQLNLQTLDQEGDRPEDVVFDYGQADGLTLFYGRLSLIWGDDQQDQEMQLEFEKIDGDFRLVGISTQYLPTEDWKKGEGKVATDFAKSYTVGDPKTGKGGISYKEVMRNHKEAQTLILSSDPATDRVELSLTYDQKNGKRVILTFLKQENGDYLLVKKDEM